MSQMFGTPLRVAMKASGGLRQIQGMLFLKKVSSGSLSLNRSERVPPLVPRTLLFPFILIIMANATAPPPAIEKEERVVFTIQRRGHGWYSFETLPQTGLKIRALDCRSDRRAISRARKILRDPRAFVTVV